MKIRIGSNQNLYYAFLNAEKYFYYYYEPRTLSYLQSLSEWLNKKHNVQYYLIESFKNDILEFKSEEDMFLFLMEWS